MKPSVRVCLGLIAASAALAFAGCGDDDAASPGAGGAAAQGGEAHAGGAAAGALTCEVIGELCHEADTGSGPAHDCHETGHVGHVDACAQAFDGCVALCVSDDDGAGGAAAGVGGAGPAPDGHCAALGELCHPVDDSNGPLHDCHELGHIGNAAQCAASFDDCAQRCLAAREELEAGTGGAAGAPGSSGAGGVSSSGGLSGAGGVGGVGGAPGVAGGEP
jgi:hypothetical protein